MKAPPSSAQDSSSPLSSHRSAPTSPERRQWLQRSAQAVGAGVVGVTGVMASTTGLSSHAATGTGAPIKTATSGGDFARALQSLFDRQWEHAARAAPEWGTFRGDHRYADRLTEASPEAEAERRAITRGFLAEAQALQARAASGGASGTAPLSDTERLSLELFTYNLERQLALGSFEGYRSLSLGALRGVHTLLSGLLQAQPVDTPEQREQLLARLAAHPRRIEQELVWLRRGVGSGWVGARPVLESVLRVIDGQLAASIRTGPFFDPFRRLPRSLDEATAEAYRARGEAAIARDVLPPLRTLRRVVAEELLPKAPAADRAGLLHYPGGDAVYAELVRQQTTTDRSPREIHEMGLAELESLHAQFRQLQAQMKLSGSFAQAGEALRGPQHFYASREAMLEGYRAVAKALDPLMPRLFVELPRIPYGIRPMADHLGPGAADNYSGPPADGSGPGWYNANTLAWQRRPKWALPTLVAHETVPGHHLQIARAREISGLPMFRRLGGYTAFSEGWALYAERLVDEIGFFERPEDRWGFLQGQAFRAARLVVDTGLHAFGWSRQRALEVMIDRVGESPVFMEAEVDRYISTPAQALAYMTGQLHILELRERSRQALGPRFDARRFNNALVDQGALPLAVLSGSVARWTAAQAPA